MKQKGFLNQTMVIKLGIKDLESCIELDKIVLNGIWTQKQWEIELTETSRVCLGLINDKKLLGFTCCSLVLDEVNITLLGIHPLYQRIGLGKHAMNSLLKYTYNLGSKVAILEVKENNYIAQSFYKRLGFKEIGHRPKLYKDGRSAIVLSKDIRNKD